MAKKKGLNEKPVYFRAERQVNPALKNYYQIETFRGLSDSNFYLLCVDEQTLELLNSLKEPKYHARWLQEGGSRIDSDEDKAFVDYLWDKLEGQLADTVMLQHLVRTNLMLYSAITGEEVNLDLKDVDNVINSTEKFTSSTPFYVPKLFAPDMSIANALYRMGQADKSALYQAQYSDLLYGKSLADLVKELQNGNGGELEKLRALVAAMEAIQTTATTAETAAALARVGLEGLDVANETLQTAIQGTMAIEETMDKVTDEIVEATEAISQAVTALSALATAMGTWANAAINAAGFLSVRNAITGVTNELQKLNSNIGGPANGDGWFAWLRWQFWGGTPPASYKPSLNDIASAHLQATREINEIQGGNPDLNIEDSIQYIGNGNGSSHK